MIARIWSGATAAVDAEDYGAYMRDVALPGYANVEGNQGVLMLRRERDGGLVEFTMVTLWRDMAAVRAFAGASPERAVFYPRDEEYLVEREMEVRHYELYGAANVPELG